MVPEDELRERARRQVELLQEMLPPDHLRKQSLKESRANKLINTSTKMAVRARGRGEGVLVEVMGRVNPRGGGAGVSMDAPAPHRVCLNRSLRPSGGANRILFSQGRASLLPGVGGRAAQEPAAPRGGPQARRPLRLLQELHVTVQDALAEERPARRVASAHGDRGEGGDRVPEGPSIVNFGFHAKLVQ